MDGINGVSPDGTVAGLFTPEPNSAALVFLRRLIGCTFDKIWTSGSSNRLDAGGSCNDANDLLSHLIALINWSMLAVIALVATYLIFASLKNTANDGELGGRGSNPGWTMVMASLGAILCFPAFNGFSALQIGTMQVAVWSTGLGDTAWRIAAEKMASSNAVATTFKSMPTKGWIWDDPGSEAEIRHQIAAALYARVQGEICAKALYYGVYNMATTGDIMINSVLSSESAKDQSASRVLYYQAGTPLNKNAGACGSVTATYYATPISAGKASVTTRWAENITEQAQIAATASELRAKASKAVAAELLTQLQLRATELGNTLFPYQDNGGPAAPREYGPKEAETVARAVDDVIAAAKKAGAQALAEAPIQLETAVKAAMKGQTSSGWMLAPLYQRVLSNGTSVLQDIGNGGLGITFRPAATNLMQLWGCYQCNDEQRTYFRHYQMDVAALEQLESAFAAGAKGTNPIGANAERTIEPDQDPGLIAQKMEEFLKWLIVTDDPNNNEAWRDPIPIIQATGSTISNVGAGILAAAGVSKVGSSLFELPLASSLLAGGSALIAPLGWGCFAIGFVLAVVVPFIPLVSFFLAALSWLILVIQSIFSAPFWLMQLFYSNQGGIWGTGLSKALVALLGILIRPVLIIAGLAFCMYLMGIGLEYLNALTAGTAATFGLAATGLGHALTNVMVVVGAFLIYLACIVVLVQMCSSLIDGLGDFVMNQIEAGASWMFNASARQGTDQALGNPAGSFGAGMAVGGFRNSMLSASTAYRQRRQELLAARRDNDGKQTLAGTEKQ